MNKEQEELLDVAYENYSKEYEKDNSIGMCLLVKRLDGKSTYRKPNKEMFVDLCTYDKTISEKWGLKIEERELSESERVQIYYKKHNKGRVGSKITKFVLDHDNIPTKLITITYNDKTIESYE
jgi:methylthioribose-1-phosphate isomerase